MSNQNNEIPDGFKKTEIGIIPEEWEVVRLEDVAEFKNGINFKAEDKGDNGILTVDVLNMYGGSIYINTNNLYRVNKSVKEDYLLKNGDILFVRSSLKQEGVGWASLFKKIEEPVTFCGFIIRARLKSNDIYPEYLVNYMRTPIARSNLVSSSGKVAITNINQGSLKKLAVPLPPLPEQKKIAHVLSTIQEAKEKTEAVIKAAKELKKSLMKYLFTYGPVPFNEAENVKLKETEIGLIPEDWEVVKLGELTTNIVDCLHSKKPARVEKGKILLQVYNIDKNGNLDLSNLYLISEKDFLEWSRRIKPRKGDIIISKVGRVGAIAHVDTDMEFAIGRNLVVIRPDHDKVFSLFLKHFMLSSSFRKEVKRLTHVGTIHKSLHVKQIPNILVSLPPLHIQQKIVSILSAVDEKIEKEENKKRALEELFKSMLHNLMTGKVRVNNLEVKNEGL